jgi:hypothetical protein
MTARQKLRSLVRSVNRAEMGLTKIIHCPYCEMDLDFTPPSVLSEDWQPPTCCAEFALAIIAILQRVEQAEMKDLADRIKDNVGGPAVFN